jgi:DNA-binding MarR family transcriptional regulator
MATKPFDEDAKQIMIAIRRLVRALRLFERESESRYGLSAAQMFVLHVLREEDELSLNELAMRTATDQSSASTVVQRLVDAGYVGREQSRRDRRAIVLSLTAKGRALVRRAPAPAQEQIFASIGKMPAADRRRFVELLDLFLTGMGVGGEAPMLFEDGRVRRSRRAPAPGRPRRRAHKAS